MLLPDYWLTRPSVDLEASAGIAFDELLEATLRMGGCPTIPYTLPWPKWQFLCHLGDHHDIALHGSGNPDIALFEPRQSNDLSEFGNQKAVYAASMRQFLDGTDHDVSSSEAELSAARRTPERDAQRDRAAAPAGLLLALGGLDARYGLPARCTAAGGGQGGPADIRPNRWLHG